MKNFHMDFFFSFIFRSLVHIRKNFQFSVDEWRGNEWDGWNEGMGDVYKIRIDIVCVCIYVMELIQIQKYGGEIQIQKYGGEKHRMKGIILSNHPKEHFWHGSTQNLVYIVEYFKVHSTEEHNRLILLRGSCILHFDKHCFGWNGKANGMKKESGNTYGLFTYRLT